LLLEVSTGKINQYAVQMMCVMRLKKEVLLRDKAVVKGKAIPLQVCAGSEDYRMLRPPDLKTIST
jgi:hypothetical protein